MKKKWGWSRLRFYPGALDILVEEIDYCQLIKIKAYANKSSNKCIQKTPQ